MKLQHFATRNVYSATATKLLPCPVSYYSSKVCSLRLQIKSMHLRKKTCRSRLEEDSFDNLADKLMPEEYSALSNWPFRGVLSGSREDTVRKQIESTPALVENAVVWLFSDAGSATESSLVSKGRSTIRAVFNRTVLKAFQRFDF